MKRKLIVPLLITLFLLVALGFSVILVGQRQEIRKKAAGKGVILGLSPATVSAVPNETFTVGITGNTGDETISAAELHFSYDASKLEAQSITAGSYLPVVLTAGQVGGGNASITLGSQPNDPKKGSGILATISFKALTPSTSNIDFSSSTQVAAVGKTVNVLQSSSGSQVIVNPSASLTPVNPTPTVVITPTSTPSVSPSIIPIPTTTSCVIPRPCLFYTIPCIEPTPPQGYCPLSPTPNITILPPTSPTCIQPPPCVYASPPCLLYPAEGRWCDLPSVTISLTSSPTIPVSITACPKKAEGDANCDGKMDGLDYSIWLNTQCHPVSFQRCGDLRADFNGDGNVDDIDVSIWYQNRGK